MDKVLLKFKEFLLADNVSKITAKNYLSDVRKFAQWYESNYSREFHPLLITPEIIEAYKKAISLADGKDSYHAARSIKRYLSSLRKLFNTLHAKGAIPSNPLEIKASDQKQETDLWRIKEFKDFLYNDNASKLTIKNYILDIQQFLTWLIEVTKSSDLDLLPTDHFKKIDDLTIDEYKNRLLNEARLSPVSINRKLSSLRRYIAWLNKKGFIQKDVHIYDLTGIQNLPKTISPLPVTPEAITTPVAALSSLHALQKQENIYSQSEPAYSKIPPVRLFQKIIRLTNAGTDFLLFAPIVSAVEASKYTFWKITGRQVFAPVQAVLDASQTVEAMPGDIIKATSNSVSNSISNNQWASANLSFLIKKLMNTGLSPHMNAIKIHNIPKSAYAPLKISTKNMSFPRKALYYIRHKRPNWYKRYHSYPVVQYFHFAIFLIFASSVGFGMYQSFFEAPNSGRPVLAALPMAPPRILSFQGRLTDSSNTPITAATDLRFAIYNNETSSGSALLWEETLNLTPDQDGVFSTQLGKKSPISQSLFAQNSSLYLGITVGRDSELAPRQQLATVAYASNSETLQGLVPITQESAGTSNVILALDSSGNLTIGDSASPTFQATGGEFTISGKVLTLTTTPGSNANVQISPDGSGIIDLQKPLQNTTNNSSYGMPPGAVEVDDLFAIQATSSGQSAFTVNQNSTGAIISASASGVAKFTVDYNGAGTFAGNLTVKGNTLLTTDSTFNIANTNTTTINLGGAATSLSIGASSGTTMINNALSATGLITANGGLVVPSGKTLTVEGAINSNLIATTSAAYDLGSSSTYWRDAFITNLFMSPSATTSGFWQRTDGLLAPANTADNLLVGGRTENTATFKISAATGNATTSGSFTFNTPGVIQTTSNQSLTIGGTTTGNIILDSGTNILQLADNSISLTGSSPILDTVSGVLSINTTTNNAITTGTGLTTLGGSLTINGTALSLANNTTISLGTSTTALNIASNLINLDTSNTRVGINTQSPTATLDIRGSSSTTPVASISGSTNTASLIIDNSLGDIFTASSSGLNRFVIKQNGNVGIGTDNPDTTLKVVGSLCVKDTQANCAGSTAGTIYATNTTVAAADLAENYISAQLLEPGDVVMPEGFKNNQALIKTNRSYESKSIGIISTKPGVTLNSEAESDQEHPYVYPLALQGRVPVKVSTINGPIHTGDPLTSSSIAGVAMKATQSGQIVAKALEDYSNPDAQAVEKIMSFVNISWYDANTSLHNIGELSIEHVQGQEFTLKNQTGTLIANTAGFSQAIIASLNAGYLHAQEMAVDSFSVTTQNITIGGQTIQDYIASIVNETLANTQNTLFPAKIISPTGEIDSIKTNIISPLASDSDIAMGLNNSKLTIYSGKTASASAVATIDNQGNASFSGTLRAKKIIADEIEGLNIQAATISANYITNITNIYNSIEPTATPSAMPTPSPIASSSANYPLTPSPYNADNNYANMASMAGVLSYTPSLTSEFGKFTQGLVSLGPTSLAQTWVNGDLHVGSNMLITDTGIDTIGSDLNIQSMRQGNIAFMGHAVVIDTDGNLNVNGNALFAKDVTVKGKLAANIIVPVPDQDLIVQLSGTKPNGEATKFEIRNASGSGVLSMNHLGDLIASGSGQFSKLAANAFQIVRGAQADTSLTETTASSSAGMAVITANETERTITSPYVSEQSLIYVTATSNTQGQTPYVARQTAHSFTVQIPYGVTKDIKFNWWILN